MIFVRYPHLHPVGSNNVVTIGNFDGVHLGHQALIKRVVAYAKAHDLSSCVVSMQPLASQYFAKNRALPVLTPFKCKFALLRDLGVGIFCVLNFNRKLAELCAQDFVDDILLAGLNAKHIIIGDDFRFGKDRVGDFEFLKNYCQKSGVGVESMATIATENTRISSSYVRQKLSHSDFQAVELSLGRKFSIFGKVSSGKKLGRELGFPTINIRLRNKAVPIKGIFCVKVRFSDGQLHIGAASIGTRPTVNGRENILEVFILDFNKCVYGQKVEIIFYHKLRNEVKFDSLDELKRHIEQDVLKTRLYFKKNESGVVA